MIGIQIESLFTSVLKVQSLFVRCLTNDQEEYKKDPFHCFYRLKASKAMTSKMCVCVCGFNVSELESVCSNLEKKKSKISQESIFVWLGPIGYKACTVPSSTLLIPVLPFHMYGLQSKL